MTSGPKAVGIGRRRPRIARDSTVAVAIFLLPAIFILAVFVVYPIGFTVIRSLFSATGNAFVGLDNYRRIVTQPRTLVALRNNAIWVMVVPIAVTSVGLVFAVLSERVSWGLAFRVLIFVPLVVSGLAAGVTFRFVYAHDPDVGLANAVVRSVTDVLRPPGAYAGARPSNPERVAVDGETFQTAESLTTGEVAHFGFVAIPSAQIPESAAAAPHHIDPGDFGDPDSIVAGVVWFDFTRGGGGTRGAVDDGELGLPDVIVHIEHYGVTVDTTTTDRSGLFVFDGLDPGEYTIVLDERSFRTPFGGLAWLGPGLITGALIASYIWINAGFALIIIGAGLSGINRDYIDSARVEGANELQILVRITIPLLRQALMVVVVTTTISVLKIFDLVIVIAPESVQADATVLALEMWRASFGGARDFGLGSALAIVLFILIIPAMVLNVRRFRLED